MSHFMHTQAMAGDPTPLPEGVRLDFLRSGRPSLDLVWTLRFRNVWPTETLTDVEALDRWLRGTYPDVVFDPSVVDADLLVEIKRLREAIYALVCASIDAQPWRPTDVELINMTATAPRLSRRLESSAVGAPSASEGRQLLAELAADTMGVLAADPARIKRCEGPDCALPFLDESRGSSRRWCTAQRCGNRVNTRAYRRRSKS